MTTARPGVPSDNPAGPLIAQLAQRIDEVLAPVVPSAPRYALLDFPDHQNVGDNAIWLGETTWLERRLFPSPAYVCTVADYSANALRSSVPDGPILLHGGGNFGDLWPAHQRFRERVCQDFPDRTIIQFPQSVWFEQAEAFERARAIIGAHPGFHLFVRDRQSLAAVETFGCWLGFCPDMAFTLGPQRAGADAIHSLLAVMREDKEAVAASADLRALLADATVGDWPKADPIRVGASATEPSEERFRAFQAAATQRLARGLDLLCSGRAVVTDRLHGHILCLLLGKPHMVADNSYGKLSSFISCWTTGAPGLDMTLAPSSRPMVSTAVPTASGASPSEGRTERRDWFSN